NLLRSGRHFLWVSHFTDRYFLLAAAAAAIYLQVCLVCLLILSRRSVCFDHCLETLFIMKCRKSNLPPFCRRPFEEWMCRRIEIKVDTGVGYEIS
ncbi:hypothetical protein CEXT_231911, partial [Caerostris extrusa]